MAIAARNARSPATCEAADYPRTASRRRDDDDGDDDGCAHLNWCDATARVSIATAQQYYNICITSGGRAHTSNSLTDAGHYSVRLRAATDESVCVRGVCDCARVCAYDAEESCGVYTHDQTAPRHLVATTAATVVTRNYRAPPPLPIPPTCHDTKILHRYSNNNSHTE